MYRADMELLADSQILIAVPLTNDQGTFTELGVATGRGIKTILWDPKVIASNMFARQAANRVTAHLPDVIEAVFRLTARSEAAKWIREN
jgi:nucleoside 2-deoxyribosyltransferase